MFPPSLPRLPSLLLLPDRLYADRLIFVIRSAARVYVLLVTLARTRPPHLQPPSSSKPRPPQPSPASQPPSSNKACSKPVSLPAQRRPRSRSTSTPASAGHRRARPKRRRRRGRSRRISDTVCCSRRRSSAAEDWRLRRSASARRPRLQRSERRRRPRSRRPRGMSVRAAAPRAGTRRGTAGGVSVGRGRGRTKVIWGVRGSRTRRIARTSGRETRRPMDGTTMTTTTTTDVRPANEGRPRLRRRKRTDSSANGSRILPNGTRSPPGSATATRTRPRSLCRTSRRPLPSRRLPNGFRSRTTGRSARGPCLRSDSARDRST